VIVVGLGAMGSAACFQLAARGVSVIGFDRYAPPHPYGSSHGDTRITRLAVAEGPEYVPLVRRSHELWREIEARSGTRVLNQCGAVILARPPSPFFDQTCAIAAEFGIEHERLDNAELKRRLPMFAADDRTEGYYEPEAGYVRPEAAVEAQLQLARDLGAELRFGETVTSWSAKNAGVTVTTATGTYAAQQLILCAGAWLPELFPEGREIFAIHGQLLYWFPIRDSYERLRDMPVFVWDFGGEIHGVVHLDGLYGFPALDGPDGGVKVGAESYEVTTTPDGRQHPATPAEAARMYRDHVQPRLPWLGPEPVRSVSCLYTCTIGNRFVIDRHPDHEAVMVVSPCSGHGFKHSPAIGELVAQLVTEEPHQPGVDVGAFRLRHAVPHAQRT
jgi:sarcosine oxidase